jgi:uncharacterized protein (TIGR03492 family)
MPGEAAARQRFLVISNGHGEDAIAAQLVARLPPHVSVDAYPMIGLGRAYDGICPLVGPRATLASEGWRNVKGSLRRDVVTGGLRTVPPALRFLRAARGQYDRVIVVGDMVGVLACLATGHRGIIYLDVYKTGAARLYSPLERWAIGAACNLVFCRSEKLADYLSAAEIDARAPGNLMMDTIPYGEFDVAARRRHPLAVALLPGSRALTGESFALQIDALRGVPEALRPDIFVAVAGNVAVEDLAKAAKLVREPVLGTDPDDLGVVGDGTMRVHLARGRAMGNLLDAADVVMSQAGTASVQALGLGKPVITFINPRDRRSRFTNEQRLFGEARTVVEAEATAVTAALTRLLSDPDERSRLGAIGRQRIGGPGALAAVLEALGL